MKQDRPYILNPLVRAAHARKLLGLDLEGWQALLASERLLGYRRPQGGIRYKLQDINALKAVRP